MNSDELKSAFDKLPPLEVKSTWAKHRQALRDHVKKANPANFLRWSTIQATMFVGEAPYIRGEYEDLMASYGNWWRRVTRESGFGNPSRLSYDPGTSGNLIHQAYHLKQWMRKSGKLGPDLYDLKQIVEIGGGYGAMELTCRQAEFGGDYWTFDLPEFILLRRFYLDGVGWPPWGYGSQSELIPKYPNLLIALFSLSEMPIDEREEILNTVDADSYLIAYQPAWEGIDNHLYFRGFAESKPHFKWSNYVNPHFKNHWYLIGVRE